MDGSSIIEARCNVNIAFIFFLSSSFHAALLSLAFIALTTKAVRVFARDVIPTTFLHTIINHDGLRRFIDQWQNSNRVRFFFLPPILFLVVNLEQRTEQCLIKYATVR